MEQNIKIKSNPLDHMRPDYMRKERRKIREGEGRNEEGRRRRRKGWTAASWAVRGSGLGGGDGQWVTTAGLVLAGLGLAGHRLRRLYFLILFYGFCSGGFDFLIFFFFFLWILL
jgi:hypothetical protein